MSFQINDPCPGVSAIWPKNSRTTVVELTNGVELHITPDEDGDSVMINHRTPEGLNAVKPVLRPWDHLLSSIESEGGKLTITVHTSISEVCVRSLRPVAVWNEENR